jgi:cytochrome P450
VQDILGTGLVTSEGALWAKQRKLVSNAFRVEILDDIVGVALRAVERLVRSAAPAG